MILLQASFKIRVTLVLGALAIAGVAGPVAAIPILQLAVDVLHRQDLQLELAGGAGHLSPQAEQGEEESQGMRGEGGPPWKEHAASLDTAAAAAARSETGAAAAPDSNIRRRAERAGAENNTTFHRRLNSALISNAKQPSLLLFFARRLFRAL